MGCSNSKDSSSSPGKTNETKAGNKGARSGVVVPEDVTKVLVDAIENHSKDTPAFDIIKASFTPDKPYCIDSFLTDKPTLLSLACDALHVDLIEFLLTEMKADPNPPLHGTFGKPALSVIMSQFSKKECLAAAKALMRAGANPNAAGFNGVTPFAKALSTYVKDGPMTRELLMILATKDGTITDTAAYIVPTGTIQNQSLRSSSIAGMKLYIDDATPLHFAVAQENVTGALVMLELGVDPTAKTSDNDTRTAQDILKKFLSFNEALYDTIQIIIDDRTQAKKATEIYDGLVAKAAAAETNE